MINYYSRKMLKPERRPLQHPCSHQHSLTMTCLERQHYVYGPDHEEAKMAAILSSPFLAGKPLLLIPVSYRHQFLDHVDPVLVVQVTLAMCPQHQVLQLVKHQNLLLPFQDNTQTSRQTLCLLTNLRCTRVQNADLQRSQGGRNQLLTSDVDLPLQCSRKVTLCRSHRLQTHIKLSRMIHWIW